MPIVLKHQAAGIAPEQENPRTKYGMAMVLQQQRSDQQMRQRTQDQQYDMQRMGAIGQNQAMREPSIGEDDAMLEQEIRGGLYDPDTVRALRQDQRVMRQIMRDTNIDGTQRAQALGNLQSRMRMSRSTGKVQPMMQQMGPAALQTKPPMTEADYFSDEKNYASAYATAQARLQEAGPDTPVTPENIQAQMHNDYLAKQKFLDGLRQPQGQGQPAAQPPNAPAAAPAAQPQASYTGGQPTFGASPVMAQGGMQQGGGQQYDQSMVPAVVDAMRPPQLVDVALAPGHPDYKSPPTPTDQRDEKGYVVMSDGSKVDPRDDFAMRTGGMGQQSVMRLTHPDGSQIERLPASMMKAEYLASSATVGPGAYQPTGGYTSPEVFGAPNVLANTAPPMQQQAAPPSTQSSGVRKWSSIGGQYSTEGEMIGTRVTPGGDPLTSEMVTIRRKEDGKEIEVPLWKLSKEDQAFVGSNPQFDYQMRNQGMSSMQQLFDPSSPEGVAARTPDPNIVNPQKETLGKPGGRYNLGMVDYGINPATGNRVTASIRPGGTMPEYDEPVGTPGTAMGGRKGTVSYMGSKKKPAAQTQGVVGVDVSPGGTPVNAGLAVAAPVQISRDDPKVQAAIAVATDPKATREQQVEAAQTLKAAGVTRPEVEKIMQATPPAATTSGQPSQSVQPSGDEVKNAYEIVKGGRSTIRKSSEAENVLKRDGWTSKDIQDLKLGRSTKKPGPPKPTQSDVRGMLDYLETGNPSDAEREVIEGVLKDAGVQVSKTPRAKSPTMDESEGGVWTPPPEGDWSKYSKSNQRSGEKAPANPSLLGQLEQAKQGDASSADKSASSPAEKMRTWTTRDNRTLEGTIVEGSVEAASRQPRGQQTITVKSKDGKFYNIPVSRLSDEDITYLEAAYTVSGYLDRYDWTTGNTIKVGKGKAYKYEKPTEKPKERPSQSRPSPRSKSYQDDIPKEVIKRPPSSSTSVTDRIS